MTGVKKINIMNMLDPLAIILLAGLVHASFQLGISVMTIMSGHAFGKKSAHRRVTALTSSYSFGSALMIMLLLSLAAFVVQNVLPHGTPALVWGIVSGMAIGTGIATWAFYFQYRKSGTILWVPRQIASYLTGRAEATTLPVETFNLGMMVVLAEIVFSITPLLISAFVLATLPIPTQLIGLALYTIIASAPHFIITALIGGGRSTARIQRWRETNKRFVQFTAGSALIILGVYIYIDIVVTRLTLGGS